MDTVIMWVGLALLVALLTFLNQKQVYSSKVKQAYRELRMLADKVQSEQSEAADLGAGKLPSPKWKSTPMNSTSWTRRSACARFSSIIWSGIIRRIRDFQSCRKQLRIGRATYGGLR